MTNYMENINDNNNSALEGKVSGSPKIIILVLILVSVAVLILAAAIFISFYKTGVKSSLPIGELNQPKADVEFYFIKTTRDIVTVDPSLEHKVLTREVVSIKPNLNQTDEVVYTLKDKEEPKRIFMMGKQNHLFTFRDDNKMLAVVNLQTKQEEMVIKTEGDDFITDVMVDKDRLQFAYLTSRRNSRDAEENPVLHIVDLRNKKVLEKKPINIAPAFYSGVRLVYLDYAQNKLILSQSGGDGGGFWQTGYLMNLKTDELRPFSRGGAYGGGVRDVAIDLIGSISPDGHHSIQVYHEALDDGLFDWQSTCLSDFNKIDMIKPGTIVLRDLINFSSTTIYSNKDYLEKHRNVCLKETNIGQAEWLDNQNIVFTVGSVVYKMSVLDKKVSILNYRQADKSYITQVNLPYLLMSNYTLFNLDNGRSISLPNNLGYSSGVDYQVLPQTK